MKRLILIVGLCFLVSGCSLIPRITFDRPGTTPQATDKSSKTETCAGEYKLDKEGDIISCTKGYKKLEQNYSQKERAYTLAERIGNYFRALSGWSFWIVVALIFLFPSSIGFILGRIIEGLYGIGTKAFRQVSSAIQKVKDTNPSLITALEASTDEDVRKFIKEFKEKNNIK